MQYLALCYFVEVRLACSCYGSYCTKTQSKCVCAVRMVCGAYKLLLINIYMPYEGNEAVTNDFANQLSVVDSLINDNLDCHIVVGGDFNVDFNRQ